MSWRQHFNTPEQQELAAQGRRNAEAAIAAGEQAAPYSRTQVRALMRRVAKLEAAEATRQARWEAAAERKARRAGLR